MNVLVEQKKTTKIHSREGLNMNHPQTNSEIFTRLETCKYLTVSKGTLEKLEIPFIRIRRRKVYRKSDIDTWLESQKTRRVNFDEK